MFDCFVSITGPIFALIVNKVGYRVASFIGSIITTVGFLLSYFASDVYHLYPTFGVLQGTCLLPFLFLMSTLLENVHKCRSYQ